MVQKQIHPRRGLREVVVFTGDLVGSSKLSSAELAEAMHALEAAAGRAGAAWGLMHPGDGAPWDPRFSSFRGDGWQCLVPAPDYALRGALILRGQLAALGRPFDTRISIGVGTGELPEQGLAAATGPAFELSGRGLDDMRHAQRFLIAWEAPPPEAPLLRAVFALADEISRKWTPAQAKVFARLLAEHPRPSQERLAGALGITQQTVAEHLTGGGDWALKEALSAVEGG
jgi:hypothetical protein